MHSWRCKCHKCRFETNISTELIALIAPLRVKITYFMHPRGLKYAQLEM